MKLLLTDSDGFAMLVHQGTLKPDATLDELLLLVRMLHAGLPKPPRWVRFERFN